MHKSRRNQQNISDKNSSDSAPTSAVIQLFKNFAFELEEKQDRFERLVKVGRDITVESKRLIFFLHSHRRGTEGDKVLLEAKIRLINIVKYQFFKVSKELYDRDIHQYLRAFSFGVQEFIEAFSFYHYLLTETLLTYEEVQDFLECNSQFQTEADILLSGDNSENDGIDETSACTSPSKKPRTSWIEPNNHRLITMVDYVLGLNDLTGELMRYSINQVANGDIQAAFDICRFLTNLYSGMLNVSFVSREYNRKMFTVLQSVKKVEMACYTVKVRGSEMPKKMIFSVLEDENICEEDVHF